MDFLAGDATGLCKEVLAGVSNEERSVRVLRSVKQSRREAVRSLLFSSLNGEEASREVTVGRASGWVEAFALESLSAAAKASEESEASKQQTRPRRAFRLPSAPVLLAAVGSEAAQVNARVFVSENWLHGGGEPTAGGAFADLPLSALIRSRLSAPCVFESPSSYESLLLAVGEAGHACVVEWSGDFSQRFVSEGEEDADKPSAEDSPRSASSVCSLAFKPVHRFPSAVAAGGRVHPAGQGGSVCACRASFMLPSPIEAASAHPLVGGLVAFGGLENDLKVFDLAHENLLWTARNSRQTVLGVRREVHVASVEWLLPVHPMILASGSASGSLRLYDLRCQRKAVFELEAATLERRPLTALCVKAKASLLKARGSSAAALGAERERLFAKAAASPGEASAEALAEKQRAFFDKCTGAEEAVVYFGDSHGALYAKRLLRGQALLRLIDPQVPKFNATSCRSLQEEASQVRHSEAEARALIRQMLDAKRQRLSSQKNSSRVSAAAAASHQFACTPVGNFKDAVGAVTGIALSPDGTRLLAVTLGRSAFVFDAEKRRLSLKVFLKQQLLCCLALDSPGPKTAKKKNPQKRTLSAKKAPSPGLPVGNIDDTARSSQEDSSDEGEERRSGLATEKARGKRRRRGLN